MPNAVLSLIDIFLSLSTPPDSKLGFKCMSATFASFSARPRNRWPFRDLFKPIQTESSCFPWIQHLYSCVRKVADVARNDCQIVVECCRR